jgi:hypothetical protein
MKSLFKALPFLFLFLINTSCNDLDDFDVSQFAGNYKFMIIYEYHELGEIKQKDTISYDGLIRRPYKNEDAEYYDLDQNKLSKDLISIEYKKDKIITFQVSKVGVFTKGSRTGEISYCEVRSGGFASKDTVKFHLDNSISVTSFRYEITDVIGVRKKF